MTRAVRGMTVRGGRSVARVASVLVCLALAACAGGGKDRGFDLPAGEQFDSVRANKVLVVVETLNECEQGSCVSAPTSPCHLGQGNTRGLALYRLGTTGLLVRNSDVGASPEQLIATDDNPRRVVVHPNDPTLLYVATLRRVQAIRLRPGGGSACFDETTSNKEVVPEANDEDPVDMVIDPSIGNGVLYVAGRGSSRVDAYTIAEDGSLPSLPSSCIVGTSNSEFASLAPMGDGFFAAGGRDSIEVHARVAGQFLPEPDPKVTPTPSPLATASPSPAPGETPGPTEPSPEPSTCINARLISTPLSSISSAFVTQMFFDPSASAPLGQLFIAEEVSERIFTFPVNADGVIDGDDTSQTKRAGVYQRMLRRRQGTSMVLYSSVFNEGRVDVFRLENGLLPNESFSRTAEDPKTLPVGLAVDDDGNVLYVAQGGVDRIDGFRIQPDGGLEDEPVTSTVPPRDAQGRFFDSFPDDVAIVPLP